MLHLYWIEVIQRNLLFFFFLLPPLPPHPQTVQSPEPGQELGLRSAGAHRATADRSDFFVPPTPSSSLSLLRFSCLSGWVGRRGGGETVSRDPQNAQENSAKRTKNT